MKTWNATIALLTAAAVAWAAVPLPQRGVVQEYDTIDALLAGDPSQLTDTYIVKGLHAINDGLAGKFYYVAGSTATTNEVAVFAWGDGRLFRTYDGVTASLVYVTGGSTNHAGDLNIGNFLRLGYVVPGLGAGNVAVYDSNGILTNAAVGGVISGANPSASVGLSAVNGSAGTYLRSDGAPALSQSIAPTWTGAHTWDSPTLFNQAQSFAIRTETYAATVDISLATSLPNYRIITLTGNLALTVSNKAAGRWFTVFLVGDGSSRTLTLPWTKYMNQAEPTALAANKTASLTVFYVDGTDANAIVNYAVMP
jgi:hypothetical protein